MVDEGREMILLESDQYKNDPVINQHIMQMIDTNILVQRDLHGNRNGAPEDPKWRNSDENKRRTQRKRVI